MPLLRNSVWDVPSMTVVVSLPAHTCAVPPRMKERAYRIFIHSSTKVSACMVTAIQMAHTNSSVLSRFPLKVSGSAALVLRLECCTGWMGMLTWGFVEIAWATADAMAEATFVMSSWV